jgi:hypothetical protein
VTPEGKKIWNSPAGGSLMAAMLKLKPLEEKDKETLEKLRQTGQDGAAAPPLKATQPKT